MPENDDTFEDIDVLTGIFENNYLEIFRAHMVDVG